MFRHFFKLVDSVEAIAYKMEKILIKYFNPNYLMEPEIDYELKIRKLQDPKLVNRDLKLEVLRNEFNKEVKNGIWVDAPVFAPENVTESKECHALYQQLSELLEKRKKGENNSLILPRIVHLYFRAYRIEFESPEANQTKAKFLDDVLELFSKYFPVVHEEIQRELMELTKDDKDTVIGSPETPLPPPRRKTINPEFSLSDSLESLVKIDEAKDNASSRPRLEDFTKRFPFRESGSRPHKTTVQKNSDSNFPDVCSEFLRKLSLEWNNSNHSDLDNQRFNFATKILRSLKYPQFAVEVEDEEVEVVNLDRNSSNERALQNENVRRSQSETNNRLIDINLRDNSQPNAQPQVIRIDLSNSQNFSSRLRPWRMSFSGREDPQTVEQFLKTLHMAKRTLHGDNRDLFGCMGEFLKGEAHTLIFSNLEEYRTWEQVERDLVAYFTKPRNDPSVKEQIYARKQKRDESFADFLIEMNKLFNQLCIPMPKREQFLILRSNMKKVYQINLTFVESIVDIKTLSLACAKIDNILLPGSKLNTNNSNKKSTNKFRKYSRNNDFGNQDNSSGINEIQSQNFPYFVPGVYQNMYPNQSSNNNTNNNNNSNNINNNNSSNRNNNNYNNNQQNKSKNNYNNNNYNQQNKNNNSQNNNNSNSRVFYNSNFSNQSNNNNNNNNNYKNNQNNNFSNNNNNSNSNKNSTKKNSSNNNENQQSSEKK